MSKTNYGPVTFHQVGLPPISLADVMAHAKKMGRDKTRLIDVQAMSADTLDWLANRPTRVGDHVRPCFNAQCTDEIGSAPKVRARLGNVFTVDAVSASPKPNGAVRIGGNCWVKSWIRVR